MFNNSLDRKPFFKKKDGHTIRDLTQSMFDFKTNDYTKFLPYKVPREYIMRPDLISQAVYNTTLYAEFILKYNGISNPLSINQDDIILIPDLETAKQNVKKVTSEAEATGMHQIRKSYKYVDPVKFPKKDVNMDAFKERNLDKKTEIKDEALPPNIADEGVKQITHRDGRVYFGEGISESACLKNGMSSSEFLTQVIKSRRV